MKSILMNILGVLAGVSSYYELLFLGFSQSEKLSIIFLQRVFFMFIGGFVYFIISAKGQTVARFSSIGLFLLALVLSFSINQMIGKAKLDKMLEPEIEKRVEFIKALSKKFKKSDLP